MRKILSILFLSTLTVCFLNTAPAMSVENSHKRPPNMEQARQRFEQRLNLTEKQKQKAKTIHQKGMKKMKPVMDQIDAKRKEIRNVKNSELDENAKKERIAKLGEELKTLEKQAREIRKKDSQDFEKILTKKQKKELEKMKAEGRERFKKHHPPKPPFNMFGAPDFWQRKPLFQLKED